jgi:hypothetical protein
MNHLLTLVVPFSTRGWHTAYSAKFRKNKDADEEEKEEMARSAFVTACMADSALQSRSSARGTLTLTLCSWLPAAPVVAGYQQFAQMGPMGKRTYGDFNAMMSKGGNMDNLSMGPQVTEELVKSCKAIINTFGDEMAAGFAAAEKQFDCERPLSSCCRFGLSAPKRRHGSDSHPH